MYELIKLTDKTYYMTGPNKVGFYNYEGNKIFLIDSGGNEYEGKQILNIINDIGWELTGIVNTHAHADHIGGNSILQKSTGCKIYAKGVEATLIKYTLSEPTYFYGAYPPKRMQSKYLMAKPSVACTDLDDLPSGLSYFELPGHSYEMIGIKTDDEVYFIGDSIFPEEILKTYHVGTIFDLEAFYDTLNFLKTLKGKYFVPTHAKARRDLTDIIRLNEEEINDIIQFIKSILKRPLSLNMITKYICDHYKIPLNMVQYNLTQNTIKSLLAYLMDNKEIDITFDNNFLLYTLRE